MTLLLTVVVSFLDDKQSDFVSAQPNHHMSAGLYFVSLFLCEFIPVLIFFSVYTVFSLSKLLKTFFRNKKKNYTDKVMPKKNFYLFLINILRKLLQFGLCAIVPMLFELIFQITIQGPRWYIIRQIPRQASHLFLWNLLFLLGAAICEELICRQMILKCLLKQVSTPVSIILSCLSFGLIHWITVPDARIPLIVSTNLIFCTLYLYQKDGIWRSCGAHFGMNMATLFVSGSDLILVPTSPFMLNFHNDLANNEYFEYRAAVIAVLAVVVYLFMRQSKEKGC